MVAVCALALLAIGSLARVFSSPIYLAWALPATAVGATFALTYGRRSLLASFAGLGGITAVTLPSLFAKELTSYLVPTRAAWRLTIILLGSGLSGMMNEASPVPAQPRYLVVLWLASITGGFLGASWIVVGRPLGAALTALGLLAYAGSVGQGRWRDAFAIGGVVLLAAFLLLDARHRIAAWTRPGSRISRTLGLPALAVACLVGFAGPVFLGRQPLIDFQNALRPRIVIIKPLSDVRRQLDVKPPVEVMRVRSPVPAYWRLTALDRYTGREWLLEAHPRPVSGGRVPEADPPTAGTVVRQEYAITSLLAPWLPAAFAARHVDSALPFDADPGTSTLLLREETIPGLRYSATSRLVADPLPSPVPGPLSKPDPDAAVFGDIARPVVKGYKTPYDLALRLQNWFRQSFRYDQKIEPGHDVARLQRFLTQRTGYCEQFAAAMTLMLRGLGMPARVGVGFLPGRSLGGEYIVSTSEAHAWTEARVPGMGWVMFDPTPGRGTPAGRTEQSPQEAVADTPPPAPANEQPTPEPTKQPEEASTPLGAGVPVGRMLGALALIAFVAGVVPGAKVLRREVRRRREPVGSLLGAYAELVDRAADLGRRSRTGQTQREVWRGAFESGSAQGAEAAERVVEAVTKAIYSPEPAAASDAAAAWRDLAIALKQLRVSLPFGARIRAAYSISTLLPSRSPGAALAGA
jgi:transglutaminase-like putative cysteine protease